MNLFDFFNFFSHAHSEIAENGVDKVLSSEEENPSVHKTYVNFQTSRKSALDAPLYAISFLFSFLRRGLQIRRNFSTTCTTLGTRGEKLQVDAALCARIAKKGANAQPCLSDMYKNSTRAKRRQADVPLCGRSMVEMLGVLAIIGVLSVGAIAGYSKAMLKYKLNKQAEQLNTLINAVARYVHSFSKEFRGQYITSYFVKLGEVPTEMIRANKPNYIYDVFGTAWYVLYVYDVDGGESINLGFNNVSSLTKNSAQNLEICRNIIVTAKENSGNINTVSTISGHQTDEAKAGVLYGDNRCTTGRVCLKNVTLEQIYDICTKHIGTQSAEFKISWRI